MFYWVMTGGGIWWEMEGQRRFSEEHEAARKENLQRKCSKFGGKPSNTLFLMEYTTGRQKSSELPAKVLVHKEQKLKQM